MCEEHGNVRLRGRNGANLTAGRIEICIGTNWRSVCTDYWGRMDAKVLCRQLGFPEGGKLPQQLSCSYVWNILQEKNILLLAGKEMEDSITLRAQGMRRNSSTAHTEHLTIEDALMQEWHAVSK